MEQQLSIMQPFEAAYTLKGVRLRTYRVVGDSEADANIRADYLFYRAVTTISMFDDDPDLVVTVKALTDA